MPKSVTKEVFIPRFFIFETCVYSDKTLQKHHCYLKIMKFSASTLEYQDGVGTEMVQQTSNKAGSKDLNL